LTATDPEFRTGSCKGAIAAAFTNVSTSANSVFFTGEQALYPNNISTLQDNLQAALDSASLSGGGSRWFCRHIGLESYYGFSDRGYYEAGYHKFTIPAGGKTGLSSVKLLFTLVSGLSSNFRFSSYGTYPYSTNPYVSFYSVIFKFTESATSFSTGAALKAMTPDLVCLLSTLNTWLPTGNTLRSGAVYIDIPKSIIENLVGNDLYIWAYLTQSSNVPDIWGSTTDGAIHIRAKTDVSLQLYQ
jgi:hypothetical protein